MLKYTIHISKIYSQIRI